MQKKFEVFYPDGDYNCICDTEEEAKQISKSYDIITIREVYDNEIIGLYEIIYSSGVKQECYLISHLDFLTVIQKKKDEIAELQNHPDNRKPKTKEYHDKKISEIKKWLTDKYSDNYFTTESPLGKAIKTGILSLPETQGGDHKVSIKLIKLFGHPTFPNYN